MYLTKEHLKLLIDEPYFSRGESYFQKGLVELKNITPTQVTAQALGSGIYKIKLTVKGRELNGSCTCPAFEDFGPCKHMAAVGFALLSHLRGQSYRPSSEYLENVTTFEKVEKYLQKQSKKELISLIMRLSNEDPGILYQLEEEAMMENDEER